MAVAAEKVKTVAKEKVESRGSTDEAVEESSRTAVARQRLLAAMVAAPKSPKVVPPR